MPLDQTTLQALSTNQEPAYPEDLADEIIPFCCTGEGQFPGIPTLNLKGLLELLDILNKTKLYFSSENARESYSQGSIDANLAIAYRNIRLIEEAINMRLGLLKAEN